MWETLPLIKIHLNGNRMKKIFFLAVFLLAEWLPVLGCTNLIVGKNASTDGSVIVSYNADSYAMCGYLCHYPASTNVVGKMRDVIDWDTSKPLGQIPEAVNTYNVIGNMNQYQVTIGETTFGGRPELVDTTATMDYGSLIYIALQRSRTAREAIKVMTDLVNEYGYSSEGESFSIADPSEVWIMEMIGKGLGMHGAVWVAVRIPDDCIAAHANQSRIHQFDMNDKQNVFFSPDVISFAREKGYFNGVNKDFSFADAYAPIDFEARRFCEARVWSFYRMFNPDMDSYISYIKGETKTPLPLYIKPIRKVSVRDIQAAMRDHFEGTPFEMTTDPGAGPYHSPYRPSPLTWKVDSINGFNERPISTQQTGFTFVAQMRANLPDAIGGVLWFGLDDANMTVYTPVYCCVTRVPDCYAKGHGDFITFSWDSAWWIYNWVSNMIYPRYDLMIGDLRKRQSAFEDEFAKRQPEIEAQALKLMNEDSVKAQEYLNDYTDDCAMRTFKEWKEFGIYLIVKYNDGVVKQERNGVFARDIYHQALPVLRPGYSKETLRQIIKATGDRYKVPQ
jgi:dipeptidase